MPNPIHDIVLIENNDRQDEKQGEETQDISSLRCFALHSLTFTTNN